MLTASSHSVDCIPSRGRQWNFTKCESPAALTNRNVCTAKPSIMRNDLGRARSFGSHGTSMGLRRTNSCRKRNPYQSVACGRECRRLLTTGALARATRFQRALLVWDRLLPPSSGLVRRSRRGGLLKWQRATRGVPEGNGSCAADRRACPLGMASALLALRYAFAVPRHTRSTHPDDPVPRSKASPTEW